jgi:hypothetical protein
MSQLSILEQQPLSVPQGDLNPLQASIDTFVDVADQNGHSSVPHGSNIMSFPQYNNSNYMNTSNFSTSASIVPYPYGHQPVMPVYSFGNFSPAMTDPHQLANGSIPLGFSPHFGSDISPVVWPAFPRLLVEFLISAPRLPSFTLMDILHLNLSLDLPPHLICIRAYSTQPQLSHPSPRQACLILLKMRLHPYPFNLVNIRHLQSILSNLRHPERAV